MEKKDKTVTAKYQLKNIEIIEQHLYILNKPLDKIVNYNFDINLEHSVDVINKNLIVNTSISIHKEDDEKLGSFRSLCIFHIENLESFVVKKTKQIDLPKDFITTLNSISISTTRGLLFSNFRGTILHSAILPIVDPSSFYKEQTDSN